MLGSLLHAMCRTRRVPSKGFKVLTSKQTGGKFYKGKGAMKTGVHTRYGKFLVLPSMRPQYVVPDLTDFKLKPYVARYEPKELQQKQEELQARLQQHKQAELKWREIRAGKHKKRMLKAQNKREALRQNLEKQWWEDWRQRWQPQSA